ncbi:bifunctional phosphoglucose/phosphomannose isomerase [bacterium]|nr:bifunctional phosphoglucose/phosphomannose isomerase [bacterium]
MLSEKRMTSIDQSGMFQKILEFPIQLFRGWKMGKDNLELQKITGLKHIVLSGMGGSAIGGDIVRSLSGDHLTIPFIVNRSYRVPSFCDTQTLFIASSYSGNTEETLSALEGAQRKGCFIICITSGGHLQKVAEQKKYPLILLPKGYPPRAALGYGIGILLSIFNRLGFGHTDDQKVTDAITFLEQNGKDWKKMTDSKNQPLVLAKKLQNKIPLIYSSIDRLEAVGFRWKTQLNENSKIHAFYLPIPEMNHNEIVPWDSLPGTKRYFPDLVMVLLRLPSDHPRLKLRMDIMKELVHQNRGQILDVVAEGEDLLSQLLYLVFFGDWVSYYLAILYGVDPTTIENIDFLKEQLLKESQ